MSSWSTKRHLISFLALWFLSGIAAETFAGHLLYLGLTETGWQVFNYDPETKETRQVTSTPGDKRRPVSSLDGALVLFRDSAGDIIRASSKGLLSGDTPLFSSWAGCGHFSILPDASGVVFTRLATDNRQRQFVWAQNLKENKPRLVYRPDRGAISHVTVSPDGEWVAGTHIWRLDEERLLICPLKKTGAARWLTPEFSVVSYPCWSADSSRIFFSMKKGKSNHDLSVVEAGSGRMKPVLETGDVSEFCPAVDSHEKWLYYEERRGDHCGLARSRLDASMHEQIALPHEAREPSWAP